MEKLTYIVEKRAAGIYVVVCEDRRFIVNTYLHSCHMSTARETLVRQPSTPLDVRRAIRQFEKCAT